MWCGGGPANSRVFWPDVVYDAESAGWTRLVAATAIEWTPRSCQRRLIRQRLGSPMSLGTTATVFATTRDKGVNRMPVARRGSARPLVSKRPFVLKTTAGARKTITYRIRTAVILSAAENLPSCAGPRRFFAALRMTSIAATTCLPSPKAPQHEHFPAKAFYTERSQAPPRPAIYQGTPQLDVRRRLL